MFSLLLGILIISCTTKTNKEIIIPDTRTTISETDNITVPSDSGIVNMSLKDGSGKIRIEKKKDRTIYIRFNVTGYNKLSAHLSSPDSTSNIRFSQIFLPNGDMDGPFSRDLEYDLPSDGSYQVSVHENMMAGDPWEGVFDVTIQLENK